MRIKGLWTAALTVWLVPVMSAVLSGLAAQTPGPRVEIAGLEKLAAAASETVDVSLDTTLLALAARFMDDGNAEEAQAKAMMSGLKGIYVRSYEFGADGAFSPADVEMIRRQLAAPGWSRMAGVRSKKENADIDVYLWVDGSKIGGSASSPPSRGASPSSTSSARSTSISSAVSRGSACPSSIWNRTRRRTRPRTRPRPRTSRSPTTRTEPAGERQRAPPSIPQQPTRIHLGRSKRSPPQSGSAPWALIGSRSSEIMPAGWTSARRSVVRSMQIRPSCCTSARSARSIPSSGIASRSRATAPSSAHGR